MLRDKSIHQLRAIAQGFGVKDLFKLDHAHLVQEIELKQQGMIPKETIEIPKPEYDARLMNKPPARLSDKEAIEGVLAPYVLKGLHLSFDHEHWTMRFGKKNDTGSLRMPLKTVLYCAGQIMR